MELNSSYELSDVDLGNCSYTTAWVLLESLQPVWLWLISVLGLMGNSLVLSVFCLQRESCSVADVYLGSLALADLVMSLCLPFWAVTVAQGYHWHFGQVACKLINTAIAMNYFCSVLFLVLVSIDRYLALARPLTRSRLRRGSWAKRACSGVWVFGFLLSLPSLLFRDVRYIPALGVAACYLAYPHPAWVLQRNLSSNVMGFVIPLPIVVFCTRHMVRALRDTELAGLTGLAPAPVVRRERRATRLVITVLAVFLLCWTPYQLVRLLDTLDYLGMTPGGCLFGHILDISTELATYLAYANSAINPFLYVMVGKHFRRRAKAAFKRLLDSNGRNATFANFNLASRCSESYKDSWVIDRKNLSISQSLPTQLSDQYTLKTCDYS